MRVRSKGLKFDFRKTLVSAQKTHIAHDEEIEKYEQDLREVERLRREYEEKLQDESQIAGRNLSLEEDQVNSSGFSPPRISILEFQMREYRRLKEEAAQAMTQFSEEYDSIDREQQVEKTNLEQEQRAQKDHLARIKQTEARIEELNSKIEKLTGYIA